MRKVAFLVVFGFVGLVSLSVLAQVTSNMAPIVAAPLSVHVPFDWKVFVQQMYTNGGGVLLGFLLSKIPGVGQYFQKFFDVFLGNLKH